MGKDYELAVYSKSDFVWDKQDLLVPAHDVGAGGPCARGQDLSTDRQPRLRC